MDNYEVGFELILYAGNARSKALMAISEAEEGNIEQAKILLQEAKEELKRAHKTQTNLIQGEAAGDDVSINMLLIHSQDHFAMAITSIDNSEIIIRLIERIMKLEKVEGI